jgi:DNA-binding NarL/FixJ family response regulator
VSVSAFADALLAGAEPAPAGAPIAVAVVDDHLPVRAGLPPLLERHGIAVVACVGAAEGELPAVAAAAPAVALVALGGAARPGLALARRLGVEAPAMAIVILTDVVEELDASSALAAGAAGVLWKGAPLETWAEAVRAVASGRLWLEREIAAAAAAEPSPYRRLSERERRVLLELARGSTTEEAAVVLHLSTHTVRTHVRNIQRKLGARTRVHALALALAELRPPARRA